MNKSNGFHSFFKWLYALTCCWRLEKRGFSNFVLRYLSVGNFSHKNMLEKSDFIVIGEWSTLYIIMSIMHCFNGVTVLPWHEEITHWLPADSFFSFNLSMILESFVFNSQVSFSNFFYIVIVCTLINKLYWILIFK